MANQEEHNINNLIWQLHRVSLDKQRVINKEQRQWEEHCQLAADKTRLIKQLAVAQQEQPPVRDFEIGDQVVIKNPNLAQVGDIFNPADWRGVITNMTPFRIYIQAESGYQTHPIPWHMCHRAAQDNNQ